MRSIIERFLPFVFLGILLVLIAVGIVLFSYLLIFGAIVGLILFVIAWIKGLLGYKKQRRSIITRHKSGRTIDHDSF
ncbi:MAG: hypothetical protein K0S27_656 [Gammaproteobacteria bacterium]|jgi:hypothetical protein|nr:hypothetical protein [Gammaproteobacteria bacterium]